MKILIITHSLERGGAEKLIVDTIPFIKRQNIDIELLLLYGSNSVPEFLKRIKDFDIKVYDLDSKAIYNPLIIGKIRSFLKKNQYDLVHVHLFPALYWAAGAVKLLRNKPQLVYTEHSNHNKRREKWYFQFLESFVYKTYDKIIGITDSVSQNLVEWIGCDHKKIVTIENGVDLASIKLVPAYDNDRLCCELGIRSSAKLILMAASFRYPKDQKTLIKAVNILGSDFHVLLAGDGAERKAIELFAFELNVADRVHFLGYRTDTRSLMKSIDFNVLSTEYEGMSGATLEAMASGKLFIGSDVPGVKELVPDSRFVFPKGDFIFLAKQISKLSMNPTLYEEMSYLAAQKVNEYDIDKMVRKHIKLYEDLI